MKQRHKFESIVAETLLIPLYYRAKESRRKNPILNDKVAEGLVDSLEYDYSRFDGAKLSEVGCVVRGWFFDRAVRRFIGKHADAVVVNVGCGLDTRFQRIGDGKAVFYDMDLPEVIALRRELIPEQPGTPANPDNPGTAKPTGDTILLWAILAPAAFLAAAALIRWRWISEPAAGRLRFL